MVGFVAIGAVQIVAGGRYLVDPFRGDAVYRLAVTASSGGISGKWWRHVSEFIINKAVSSVTQLVGFGGDVCGIPGYCNFNAVLALSASADGTGVVARYTRVWYTVDVRTVSVDHTFEEDAPRVGDTLELSVDPNGHLNTVHLGRFSDTNDLDGDGQLDDAYIYCNERTEQTHRAPCGA